MRFPLVALVWLAAFGGKFGADARAIQNDLALRSSSLEASDIEAFAVERQKPKATVPNLPRAPLDLPRPVKPEPVKPKPVKPEPVHPDPAHPDPAHSNGQEAKPIEVQDDMSFSEADCRKRGEKHTRGCTDISQVPSVQELQEMIVVPKDKAVFYSGPGPQGYSFQATQFINKKVKAGQPGYKYLPQMWKDKTYPDKFDGDARKLLNARVSEAMARSASGEVHVVLPSDTKGTDWHKGTVWDVNEYPNLGPDVTKIIRVNPDNDDEEVIPKMSK